MGCVKVFLLILISKLTLAEYCLRTLETLKYVPTCPSNEREWEAASKKMNCSKIKKTLNCENAIYHCLRDALSKTMVEVCTVPRKLTAHCPLFYTNPPYVRNDLDRDCSKNNTCPSFYSSEDAYKYVACNNNTSLTTTESTSEPTSSFVTHTNTIRVQSTPALNVNSKGQNGRKQESDNEWMMIFFPALVCLLIVAYIIAVVWLKTRKHIPLKQAVCIHRHIECQREGNDDQRLNTANLQRADIERNGEENACMPLLDPIDPEGNYENKGNNNPNLTTTPVEDHQRLGSITTDKNNSAKNGTSEISSSSQDITTDTQRNISAEPENRTLPINTPDSMTQNNSHLPQSNTPISEDCVSDHAVKTDTPEKNIPGVSNNICPQNPSAVNQEEASSDMNPTSDPASEHDAKASGGELPQSERKQKEISEVVVSTALLCSEESSNPEVTKKDQLDTFLDLDVSADADVLLDPKANVQSPASMDMYMKKKLQKKGGTRPIDIEDTQVNDDSEIPERNVAVLEKGLDKADKRIYELLKEQYKLKGRARYLEIKLNCIKSLLSELEMDFCAELNETVHKKSKCDNLRDKVTCLEKEYSCVLRTIKDVESIVLPNQSHEGTSASTCKETCSPDDGADGHGACGSDLTSKVCILENSVLPATEGRLNKLYEEGYGKEGQLKANLAKMRGLECAVNQLENDYGLQVTSFTTDDEQTMKMVDKAPERLDKIFRRLEEIDLHILK